MFILKFVIIASDASKLTSVLRAAKEELKTYLCQADAIWCRMRGWGYRVARIDQRHYSVTHTQKCSDYQEAVPSHFRFDEMSLVVHSGYSG